LVDPQAWGRDVSRHQLNPVERVGMSGPDLADSVLRHGQVLRLNETDGPDSLSTCQQTG
jgi:hypothetical protein